MLALLHPRPEVYLADGALSLLDLLEPRAAKRARIAPLFVPPVRRQFEDARLAGAKDAEAIGLEPLQVRVHVLMHHLRRFGEHRHSPLFF